MQETFPKKTMKACRWYAPEKIQLDEVPTPRPAFGEVLVKIGAATTCGTDFKTFKRGHPRLIKTVPAPFGHEMAGSIAALGEGVAGFALGDRVVVGNSSPCGECFFCREKQWSLCEDLQFLNGAYAEYLLVPERIVRCNLHKIPEHLSFSTAALSEPLACVINAFEKVAPRAGQKIALLGSGPMAVLFVQLAKLYGCELLALARDPAKLENLKNFGADAVVSLTRDANPLERAREFFGERRGADIVIEAVGLPETWRLATELARPGGKICFYGGCARGSEVAIDTYRVHYEELQLFGVFHHTPEIFARAVDFLAEGKLTTEGLIVGSESLENIGKVFRPGLESHPLKYAIIP